LLLAPAHLHASIHVAALDESHFLEDQQWKIFPLIMLFAS
jgi:hypothetical protein